MGAKFLKALHEDPCLAAASQPLHLPGRGIEQLLTSAPTREFLPESRRGKLDEGPERLTLGSLAVARAWGSPPELFPDRVGLPPVPGEEQGLSVPKERRFRQSRQRDRRRREKADGKPLEETMPFRVTLRMRGPAGAVPVGRQREVRRYGRGQRSRQITNSASASKPSR